MTNVRKITVIVLTALACLAMTNTPMLGGSTIPNEYQGTWCVLPDHPYYIPKIKGDGLEECITITARRFDSNEEYACDLVNITPDVSGHIVKLNCHSDEGNRRTKELINEHWSVTTGTKGLGKRLYIKKCVRSLDGVDAKTSVC